MSTRKDFFKDATFLIDMTKCTGCRACQVACKQWNQLEAEGPTWYRKPSEIRLKKNERIKLNGVWAEINGKDVFMASKIKKDPDTEILKVRLTKDGTPFWTMTSEQIAMEMKKD